MESQTINQKMKLTCIAIILSLLGKIALYESIYITYKYEVYKYDVLCYIFFNAILRAFSLPNSVQNYTLKYLLK